jgi:hypothetical protein
VGIWSRSSLPGSLRHCNATALTWSDAARQGITRTSSNGIRPGDEYITASKSWEPSEKYKRVGGFSLADVAAA